MARLVQKYGGTSVKNIDCIKNVAQRIKESYDSGNELIVVVSARAGITDQLINDAKKISDVPNQRELDVLLCVGEQETVALLAIALNEIGVKAVSRLAFQVGIHTCDSHGSARITDIDGWLAVDICYTNAYLIILHIHQVIHIRHGCPHLLWH